MCLDENFKNVKKNSAIFRLRTIVLEIILRKSII